MKQVSPKELKVLRYIAIGADALQFGLIPVYFVVIGAVINAFVDIVLFGLFTWRLGFHVAFLPSFIAEFIPLIDLIPAWTMAVYFVTRNADGAVPPVTFHTQGAKPGTATVPPSPAPFIKDIKSVDSPNAG